MGLERLLGVYISSRVRVEEPHLPGQEERRGIVYTTVWLGKDLVEEFARLKTQAQHLLPDSPKDNETLEIFKLRIFKRLLYLHKCHIKTEDFQLSNLAN